MTIEDPRSGGRASREAQAAPQQEAQELASERGITLQFYVKINLVFVEKASGAGTIQQAQPKMIASLVSVTVAAEASTHPAEHEYPEPRERQPELK